MIFLNKPQADDARGLSDSGHAIDPIPLDDSPKFILGDEVLTDPFHAGKRAKLSLGERRPPTQAELDIITGRNKV